MSLEYAKAKREERAALAKQMTDLAALVQKEDRDFTPEEAQQFDKLEAGCRELEALYLRLERAAAQQAELDATGERRELQRWVDKKVLDIDDSIPTSGDYDQAFRGWLLAGRSGVTEMMTNAMRKCGMDANIRDFDMRMPRLPFSGRTLPKDKAEIRRICRAAQDIVTTRATTAQTITTTGGGNVVGDDNSLIGTIFSTLLTGGAVRSVATVIQTDTGASLPIPLDDNRSKGTLVAINAAVDTADLSLGQLSLGAKKYGSMVKLPVELIQDAAIDIQSFTGTRIGERLQRITEEHFATGAASLSEPEGLVTTGSSGGAAAGTTASSTAVSITDLKNVVASLDAGYLNGASWMMHQTLRSHIAGLLDADGRPLWQPSLTMGFEDTLMGYPVAINNEYVAYTGTTVGQAAADKIATFGQHSHYYIRDVMQANVRRLDERFAELAQVAVIGFSRHDGLYINGAVTNTTNASIKLLVAAAS